MIYRFEISRADLTSPLEVVEGDFSNDFTAGQWMNTRRLARGEGILGFCGNDERPFARRASGGVVEAVR